jgi:hypothetical protein
MPTFWVDLEKREGVGPRALCFAILTAARVAKYGQQARGGAKPATPETLPIAGLKGFLLTSAPRSPERRAV